MKYNLLSLTLLFSLSTAFAGPSKCPFITSPLEEDQNVFSGLQNYFKTVSTTEECAKTSSAGMKAIANIQSAIGAVNQGDSLCLSTTIDQEKFKNEATTDVKKGIEISQNSPFRDCNSNSLTKIIGSANSEKRLKCIDDLYAKLAATNTEKCKTENVSEDTQSQVMSGVNDLQKVIASTVNSPCGLKTKDVLKTAIEKFSKVKALTNLLPWGGLAGAGVDLLGEAIDNYMPSEVSKTKKAVQDLIDSDNYEQTACLYFYVQQQMYCSDFSQSASTTDPLCVQNPPSENFVGLLDKIQEIKKGTDLVTSSENSLDTDFIETKIDDLIKYATASEPELRQRLTMLPKIQQASEKIKIDRFYNLLNFYASLNLENTSALILAKATLEEILSFINSKNASHIIKFDFLVFQSTPGLKLDVIKNVGMANAIRELQNSNSNSSRKFAKFSKYKNNMNEFSQNQIQQTLQDNFINFKNQMDKQVTSPYGKNVAIDLTTEGMLRDLVRHCVFLQEIYDSQFAGKIPQECARLNCGKENRLKWFTPVDGQESVSLFQKSYCDKTEHYKEIEDNYISDLKKTDGPQICGMKAQDFFK